MNIQKGDRARRSSTVLYFYEPNCLINLETRTSQGKERSCLEIADAEVQVIDLGGLKKVVR